MPKSSEGLTPQYVLSALADLDSGIEAPFDPATGCELFHDGQRHAPKAVIALAVQAPDRRPVGGTRLDQHLDSRVALIERITGVNLNQN